MRKWINIEAISFGRVHQMTICRPKDQGGLGMLNTKVMNDCL